MEETKRIATMVDWLFAPEWLTIEEACFLSGWSESAMKEIIEEGGVDLNMEELIEKRSLREFNECAALILHWND
jgi:hypothetical protein